MKKRERTINLVSEAEMLDTQNIDLKSQVRTLEMERRTLSEMLQAHRASCARPGGFEIPVCTLTVAKYLTDIGLSGGGGGKGLAANELSLIKPGGRQNKTQKIPSMSTLKFNRRSQTQPRQTQSSQMNNNPSASICNSSPSVSAATVTSAAPPMSQSQLASVALDMGYGEGTDLNMVNDVILSQQQSAYAKTNDCYAISSPDSGFIKSPVDLNGNGGGTAYGNMVASNVLLKSDYIPNCDAQLMGGDALVISLPPLCSTPTSTNGGAGAGGGGGGNGAVDMGFILKSELVDGNESPYTSMQSADRFLFDGSEVFETDIEQQQAPQHHLPITNVQHVVASPPHMQTINSKTHTMLLNNNNNIIIGAHNQHNGDCGIPVNMNGINEYAVSQCQQYIDYSLLKSDFLGQGTEYFTSDANDGQFNDFTSTDMDSGVTTFTTNGCVA